MTLKQFIEEIAKKPFHVWAGENEFSPDSVYAWVAGRRKPSMANLQKLMRITGGAVGPMDFK